MSNNKTHNQEIDPVTPSTISGLELVNIPFIDNYRHLMLECMPDNSKTLDFINQEACKMLQLVELIKSGVEPICKVSEDTLDEDSPLLDVTAGELDIVLEEEIYKEIYQYAKQKVTDYANSVSFVRISN